MSNTPRTTAEREFNWTFDKRRILQMRYPSEGASDSLISDIQCPTAREVNRMAQRMKLTKPLGRTTCRRKGCTNNVIADDACLYHWVMTRLNQSKVIHGENAEICTQMVRKLEDSGYKCYYSGRKLIPGVNTSIDHVLPASFGGGHEVDNLVWVDSDVNFAKQTLDNDEFVKQCIDIALHSSLVRKDANKNGVHYLIDWFNQNGYKSVGEEISKYV